MRLHETTIKINQKGIKNVLFFLLAWSLLLIMGFLITNTNFFDWWFTMHYYCVEKLFSAHRFGQSIFTRRNIINKVFTKRFWDSISGILVPERYINLQGSPTAISVTWYTSFYSCGENHLNVPVGHLHLFKVLWKISCF